ncbi:MAG: hypothetical protein BWY10_01631 [Chloroflexi bacterium ADurb.Bin180]|nr:MAG: hypothetical protein BWY10_01631 [Chloroflexi bacterium ADurb.Bin180]
MTEAGRAPHGAPPRFLCTSPVAPARCPCLPPLLTRQERAEGAGATAQTDRPARFSIGRPNQDFRSLGDFGSLVRTRRLPSHRHRDRPFSATSRGRPCGCSSRLRRGAKTGLTIPRPFGCATRLARPCRSGPKAPAQRRRRRDPPVSRWASQIKTSEVWETSEVLFVPAVLPLATSTSRRYNGPINT